MVALFTDRSSSLLLCRPDPWIIARRELRIDPILDGHFVVEVEDLDRIRSRLDDRGAFVAEIPAWEYAPGPQLYCYEPGLNVVAVSERAQP